jgi:hypothetical protein
MTTSLPETRQVLLDTNDIGWFSSPPSQTSYQANSYINPNVGELNNRLTDATWYRVNLKQLMGDEMWNNYSQFNLILRNWSMSFCADLGSNVSTVESYNDRSLFIMMSGPHWVNNWSTRTKTVTSEAVLGVYSTSNIGATEGFSQPFYGSIQTFDKKNGPIEDLRIRFLRTVDSQPPLMNGAVSNVSPTNMVHWSMIFDITPVESSRTSKKNLTAF